MADKRNHLIVAAIDFGTTYSGYAYSMRHEFKKDPLIIHANPSWKSGGRALMSMKTPTSLLLNKNKEFVAFGYDAENQYIDFIMDGDKDEYFYFHRFKMNLHNNKNITNDMIIEDVTGKPLGAVEVFQWSIKALVDHLMNVLDTYGTGVKRNEVQWVLTVPAIWTDTAKQFMRSSAERADVPTDKLLLALEPETASIFCQYLPIEKLKGSNEGFAVAKEGTEYMVVDLGGGTADITVHQKAANGQLIELCRATGNDGGGTSVDRRFFRMLEEIVGGSKVITALKEKEPLAYIDLFREFEAIKRTVDTKKKTKVNMTVPVASLDKQCNDFHKKSFETMLKESKYSKDMTLFSDKLRVSAESMKNLFTPTIDSIIRLMKEILRKPALKNVEQILMVGGFSECDLIQDAVCKEFPNKRIIVPEEAGMTVMKGAVLFGHKPDYVSSRVMRFTYGIKTNLPFDKNKFDVKNLVVMDGEERCDNIFSRIVEKDKSVEADTIVKKSYFTPYKNQKEMNFEVYYSDQHNPSYIDDEGCTFLCKPTITFPYVCEERRWVDVEYIFGNTEIGLKVVDRNSGEELITAFNLL